MGLNGLVLRNVVGYVKKLKIVGDFKEHDLDECSRKGRVPDSSMMLNTLVRVAVERATSLKDLSWELNTKMLPTVWQGLVNSQIQSLTVQFPSCRTPRPVTTVPPLANLVSLKVLDIDPLCYTDDISLLLAGSRKLRKLSLVWSPRMREAKEPSVHLGSLFRRCRAPDTVLRLTHVTIKNLFSYDDGSCTEYNDPSLVEEVTTLNSTGGHGDSGGSAFIDNKMKKMDVALPRLKMIRGDQVSKELIVILSHTTGLEKIYILGPKKTDKNDGSNGYPQSPASDGSSPASEQAVDNLRDEHIEAITRNHGQTLRHLLLPPQWRLTSDNIALIIRHCPNLEQVGFGADFDKFSDMRLLMPFLPKVNAIRILDNPDCSEFRDKMHEMDDGRHEKHIGSSTSAREWSKIRYMQLADLLFEAGKVELMEDPEQPGKMAYRRRAWKQSLEAVKDVAIWKMDSLDVF
ncbi:MAG: hypothetical protein Q9222_004087 [Ikaeria aurantiellina]